ncbi:MAG: multicopper oxidase domain-containing protein [Anaerolineales bacterium]|nr:multicopper oxidase domain-containing protein [Anaerolineales bacterium]
MKPQIMTRRDFLRLSGLSVATLFAGGGFASFFSSCATPGQAIAATTPVTLSSGSVPNLEIALRAVPVEMQLISGEATRVWQYQGEVISGPTEALTALPNSYLGPTIRAQRGQNMRIHFTNDLPEESIIHWHGLHVPESADGHPRLAIAPGETYTYEFTVADRAGMYWYHPHPHGRTGPQVYGGLAGLFIVTDEEEQALGLPSGEYDVPLVIQDRLFDDKNQLVYGGNGMMDQMMGFLGNRLLINGQTDFGLSVATRPYRLRLLNGSNSRIYKLGWEDGSPLTVIGTDGGLLEAPMQKEYITLAPAQRLDLWVDFSDRTVGEQVRLVNLPSAVPDGTAFPVLNIKIERNERGTEVLPEKLSSISRYSETEAANRRSPRDFTLSMGMGMRWMINGRTFEMEDVARDEVVKLGDLEAWQFTNQAGGGMGMMGGMALPHPMHIHGLQFQVVEREVDTSGRAARETLSSGFVDEGWHDTVLVMPGERVKILLKFEDFEGLYLYHCHNLEHEDMGMMRNYRVEA